MCGITWCASPSANATTPSTRRSKDCPHSRTARLLRILVAHHALSQALQRGRENFVAGRSHPEPGQRRPELDREAESHPGLVVALTLQLVLAMLGMLLGGLLRIPDHPVGAPVIFD